MTIQDDILGLLKQHPTGLDDDQIAGLLHLSQRQTANQVANRLASAGKIRRARDGGKIRNYPLRGAQRIERRPDPHGPTPERSWHWEGHVQSAIVDHLQQQGWTTSSVDTASKERGKDIEGTNGGRRLWVTVKGYPDGTTRTNPSTQARHWFSHALFDVALYRGEDPEVRIAVGLPDFGTYKKLAARVRWLEEKTPFSYLWVQQDGRVSS